MAEEKYDKTNSNQIINNAIRMYEETRGNRNVGTNEVSSPIPSDANIIDLTIDETYEELFPNKKKDDGNREGGNKEEKSFSTSDSPQNYNDQPQSSRMDSSLEKRHSISTDPDNMRTGHTTTYTTREQLDREPPMSLQSQSPQLQQPPETVSNHCIPVVQNEENIRMTLENKNRHNLRLARHKRRRRLRKQLRGTGNIPSFVAVISPESDYLNCDTEDNDSDTNPIKKIKPSSETGMIEDEKNDESNGFFVIDVDEYLGLKTKIEPDAVGSTEPSSQQTKNAKKPIVTITPADEGWYEGSIAITLQDESRYLEPTSLHHFIRSNLEFFSVPKKETDLSYSVGRKTLGQVGIRCKHCARKVSEVLAANNIDTKSSHKAWPPGSISFPGNLAGIYQTCSQKIHLHFENCKNLSDTALRDLFRLTRDKDGNKTRRSASSNDMVTKEGIPMALYYVMSAKRLGLVDTNNGLRFSRDLTLAPLPMDSVRAQVENNQEIYRRSHGGQPSLPSHAIAITRIRADEESEKIRTKVIAEEEDQKEALSRPDDMKYISDFLLICVKQMVICHALPPDVAARAKRQKNVRLGIAGFCCRYCSDTLSSDNLGNYDFSYRSFPSSAEGLYSAISSYFTTHLQKCALVPTCIKKTLSAYKKIHSKQQSNLPLGSQKRYFDLLWKRMRVTDKSEEEMDKIVKTLKLDAKSVTSCENLHSTTKLSNSKPTADPSTNNTGSRVERNESSMVPPVLLPACKDEETLRVLREAEEKDLSTNDNLLLPSDRPNITDYMFLLMKQLKIAKPNDTDLHRSRKIANKFQTGLRCIHCIDKESNVHVSSARSFPSQAESLSSSLNLLFYDHMQKCIHVPSDIRRSLRLLKNLHPAQVSSLQLGSQRAFHRLLWDRLPRKENQFEEMAGGPSTTKRKFSNNDHVQQPTVPVSDELVAKFNFIQINSDFFQCQLCRMVPLELRALNSLSLSRPSEQFMRDHHDACQADLFDLDIAADTLNLAVEKLRGGTSMGSESIIKSAAFEGVVNELVGYNAKLVRVFTLEIAEILKARQATNGCSSSAVETKGLWCAFPPAVDMVKLQAKFELFVKFLEPSATSSRVIEIFYYFRKYFQIISPSFVVDANKTTNKTHWENGRKQTNQTTIQNHDNSKEHVRNLHETAQSNPSVEMAHVCEISTPTFPTDAQHTSNNAIDPGEIQRVPNHQGTDSSKQGPVISVINGTNDLQSPPREGTADMQQTVESGNESDTSMASI